MLDVLFLITGIVRCPTCGKILSSTNSFKYSGTPKEKVYYHLTCKNPNCSSNISLTTCASIGSISKWQVSLFLI